MIKLNRSIERGLLVLEVIHTSGAASLSFLAVRTGLPKPTLLRICATLESRRWLSRRRSDGCYQLGSAFPHMGGMMDLIDRLVSVGKAEIVQLSGQTGLGVDLAASIGDGRIEIVDTTRDFKKHGVFPDTVGFRPSPVLSALGLAFLHALPAEVRANRLRDLAIHLPRDEIAAVRQVPARFKTIDQTGYAVRAAGHWGRAVDYGALPTAIAVAVMVEGTPVGAINLVWNASDGTVEQVASRYLGSLRRAASNIGAAYSAGV